ncbi:MAG: 16S rRNA (cytosine(967)-C(5))-methyltransferase RsmB [Acutalibacteraceae bacterium]
MKTPRQLAYEILLKIEQNGAYSNIAIDSAIKSSGLDSTDCAFISRLCYGVLERKITLDYIIGKYLKQPIEKTKPQILTDLRLGAYQIIFMDKIPHSAAVNEAVNIIKSTKFTYAAGLINAVLRKISADGFSIDESLSQAERISVEYSIPLETVKFFIYHYGAETTELFLAETLKPKKITIRVNNIKTTADELTELLKAEGVTAEKTELPNALNIDVGGAVYNLECYKQGLFHVEDLSSQYCVEALDVFKGYTCLDVCSAPGGKSFTIAENMQNTGSLLSCDIYPQRTELIKSGAERLGLTCIKPTVNDAEKFNKDFPQFDRVLCDVPCSGLGIIGKKPEIKYKKLDDIKCLLPIQKNILETSSKYVKKGGKLVYSTCSVNPNENRKICDAFLKEHTEFKSLKALPETERTVDEGDYLTLFPHKNNCDGFFIAVFERK